MISASPRRLTVFKSVVELGGFNAAATQLGIAQPSVGAHIRALESQVGQPLFHRQRGSRPRLTKAGEALYTFAVDLLRRSEEATHALDDLRKIDAHEIAIAVHRDLLSDRYSALACDVRKTASKGKNRHAHRHHRGRDRADPRARGHAWICSWRPGRWTGIRSEVLSHEPLLLVVVAAAPAGVARARFAARGCASSLRHGAARIALFRAGRRGARGIGIARYDVAMELQESTAVKEMVRHGAGIACLPPAPCAPRSPLGRWLAQLRRCNLSTDLRPVWRSADGCSSARPDDRR